jgi:hypothetical protein
MRDHPAAVNMCPQRDGLALQQRACQDGKNNRGISIVSSSEFPQSMTLARLVPDGDGPAFFRDMEIPYTTVHTHGAESEIYAAREIAFVWTASDFAMDFHSASRQRLIIVLSGQMEIEDGAGECRLFGPGDVIDIQDTTGKGHKTRVIGDQEMHTALIETGEQIRPDWPEREEDTHRTAAFTRTITGPDGGSVFQDDQLVYGFNAPLGPATKPQALAGYQFVFKPATLDHGNHNAPQRQFVLPLSSGMEVETSDNARRRINPGDVYLGEDTTGQGHKTRAVDGQARISIFAHLA